MELGQIDQRTQTPNLVSSYQFHVGNNLGECSWKFLCPDPAKWTRAVGNLEQFVSIVVEFNSYKFKCF